MPSILLLVTIARAAVRFSAMVNSACRHSSGSGATTSPARPAASTVSANSTVLGSWTAITEFAGKPDSMKCAARAEIARSACAKERRLRVWPVMRCLLRGSTSASESGCRARTRLNRASSVGEAVGWVTGSTSVASLRLRVRLLPPRLRQIARQRRGRRPFYPIPAREPLLLHVKQRDSVETRHQDPVQRPHRRDEGRLLARLQQRRDQRVDRGVPGAHV